MIHEAVPFKISTIKLISPQNYKYYLFFTLTYTVLKKIPFCQKINKLMIIYQNVVNFLRFLIIGDF